jgi:D-alanyl-D-alanine carboxypeptidase
MKLFAVGAALCFLTCLQPSVSCGDEVDDYVRGQMTKQHIPGLSLAVVKNEELMKASGYGLANVELNVPAQPETVYQIQSITKTFTATAVMLLANEGKVGLEDKINKYLDGLPGSWEEVTVRHLLTHTSGIRCGHPRN